MNHKKSSSTKQSNIQAKRLAVVHIGGDSGILITTHMSIIPHIINVN